LSRMIRVESLCCQSRRVSATRACALATLTTVFVRFWLPRLLAGQGFLQPAQLAGGPAQELRRYDLRAVREDHEVGQSLRHSLGLHPRPDGRNTGRIPVAPRCGRWRAAMTW
jgi:hypothetical protein